MSQITWLLDQILLDRLPLLPCAGPPRCHRPLVEPEGSDDSLQRTTMREQCHHGYNQLSRRTQPVEDRAFRRREGFVALLTDKPLLLARVDTDIALADLASGRTCQVRAKYSRGVHAGSPLLVLLGSMPRRSIAGPPLLLQVHFSTVEWRATVCSLLPPGFPAVPRDFIHTFDVDTMQT